MRRVKEALRTSSRACKQTDELHSILTSTQCPKMRTFLGLSQSNCIKLTELIKQKIRINTCRAMLGTKTTRNYRHFLRNRVINEKLIRQPKPRRSPSCTWVPSAPKSGPRWAARSKLPEAIQVRTRSSSRCFWAIFWRKLAWVAKYKKRIEGRGMFRFQGSRSMANWALRSRVYRNKQPDLRIRTTMIRSSLTSSCLVRSETHCRRPLTVLIMDQGSK